MEKKLGALIVALFGMALINVSLITTSDRTIASELKSSVAIVDDLGGNDLMHIELLGEPKPQNFDYEDERPWVVNPLSFPNRHDYIPTNRPKQNSTNDPYQPVVCDDFVSEWGNLNNMSTYSINTNGAEDSPFITPDGKTFYFYFKANISESAYEEIHNPTSGIYMANWDDIKQDWTEPVRLGLMGVGDPYNISLDGAAMTYDNQTMVFASVRYDLELTGQFDLYYTKKVGDQWAIGHNMRQPLNSINPGYAGEPHLLPHGRTILYNYVGSDGWGLNNISYSLYNATTGVWSAPVQLPAPINNYVTGVGGRTAGMPFVSYDGEEFWFTGNGSLTGPSLYRSFILSGSGPEDWVFSEPQEIVKSLAGECTMAADGKYMYFVHHFVDFSTPEDFIKDVDIYRLERLIPKNNNPIFINGSDPAHDWDQCPYVTGSGTPASPYIIADVEFKGFGYGHTISIVNSNAHFEIKNCSIRKGGYILSDGGIHLQNVSNGVITRNQIYDNGNDGIFLQNCSNILIWNNTITSNENLGVRLDAMTKNCLIHNNTFISNWRYNSGLCASQGWDDGMNNRWDNGIVGNSWDNYLGTDGNGDGIGDVPYPICGSASNSDLFPYLTEPTPGTPDPPESEDPPPSQPNDPDPGQINGFCISFVVALMVITTSVRALRKTRR